MAFSVQSVQTLKAYFSGVAHRSDHHAGNVDQIIYPLLGFIILYMDENQDIKVYAREGAKGNMLWVYVNSMRYAFRYEHSDQTIEIREQSYKGKLISKIDNNTTIDELSEIFDNL